MKGKGGLRKRLNKIGEKLPYRQTVFVAEYLVDGNGTRAAKAAGYSAKIAHVMACKLLKRPEVAKIVALVRKQDMEKIEMTREDVLRQLFFLTTRDARDFVGEDGAIKNVNDMNDRARAVIDAIEQETYVDAESGDKTIKTKIRLSGKATAVDLAMKYKGMFAAEKVESVHSLNWDELTKPRAIDVNPVELAIEEAGKPLELGLEGEGSDVG